MCHTHKTVYTACSHSEIRTTHCSNYLSQPRLVRYLSRQRWVRAIGIYPHCLTSSTCRVWHKTCRTCVQHGDPDVYVKSARIVGESLDLLTQHDPRRYDAPHALMPSHHAATSSAMSGSCWEDIFSEDEGSGTSRLHSTAGLQRDRRSSSLTRVSSQPFSFEFNGIDSKEEVPESAISPMTKTIKPEYESELRCMRIRIANDYARLKKIAPTGRIGTRMFGSFSGSGNGGGLVEHGNRPNRERATPRGGLAPGVKDRRGAVDFGRVNGPDLL